MPSNSRQQLSKSMEHLRGYVTIENGGAAGIPKPLVKNTVEPTLESVPETGDGVAENGCHDGATHGTCSTAATTTATCPDTTVAATEEACAHFEPVRNPPHRSHDPANNQKRSDPFQFGSRYLQEGDNIFEFNAWDHVETDEAYRHFAETQYQSQRDAPVSAFDKKRFNETPEKWWNTFYSNNNANFFKDRKWLFQEFPLLAEITRADAPPAVVLEVGAGAGNTAYPLLAQNENPCFKIHACDYSKKAVEIIRSNEKYDFGKTIVADVWNIAATEEKPAGAGAGTTQLTAWTAESREPVTSESNGPQPDSSSGPAQKRSSKVDHLPSAINTTTPAGLCFPPGLGAESVDVVLLIFIFSALSPAEWAQAVKNVWAVLKPGGHVLFRDYARGDLAQVRFKKGRWMGDNFYVRGDGTRVYFFDQAELESIWTGDERFWRDWAEREGERKGAGSKKGEEEEGEKEEGDPSSSSLSTIPSESSTGQREVDETQRESTSVGPASMPKFRTEKIAIDNRMLVNRKRQLKMYRSWVQARFQKPVGEAPDSGSSSSPQSRSQSQPPVSLDSLSISEDR